MCLQYGNKDRNLISRTRWRFCHRWARAINPFLLSSLSLLPSFPAASLNVAAACPLEGCGCSGRPPYRYLPLFGIVAAGACTNMGAHASQTQNRHVSSYWSRYKSLHRHKHACITRHKRARNRNPLRWRRPRLPLWPMSASLGGSLFCSWTCPEQGSHTVVLDGSLFEKEQGGHTFSFEPRGAATA